MKKVLPKPIVNQKGKWVEKPTRSTIVLCECGNKYIKTRENQKVCVMCLSKIV